MGSFNPPTSFTSAAKTRSANSLGASFFQMFRQVGQLLTQPWEHLAQGLGGTLLFYQRQGQGKPLQQSHNTSYTHNTRAHQNLVALSAILTRSSCRFFSWEATPNFPMVSSIVFLLLILLSGCGYHILNSSVLLQSSPQSPATGLHSSATHVSGCISSVLPRPLWLLVPCLDSFSYRDCNNFFLMLVW